MSLSISAACRKLRHACSQLPSRATLAQEKCALVEVLVAMGCTLAGEGSFGSTLVHGSTAIKIVLTRESRGYLAYARFCRNNHSENRLLPRVEAIHEVGRYSLVCMERLYESQRLSTRFKRPLRRVSRNHEHVNETSRLIGRSQASLAQVMTKLSEILSQNRASFWDIKEDNILFRREGGKMKVVLTDPIAY